MPVNHFESLFVEPTTKRFTKPFTIEPPTGPADVPAGRPYLAAPFGLARPGGVPRGGEARAAVAGPSSCAEAMAGEAPLRLGKSRAA